MATSKKTPKAEPTAKKDAASADKSASTDTSKTLDAPKTADPPKAADATKTEATDTGGAPKNYSRGEGQKAVTQAYRDNWHAIFGDKKNDKKKRP